MSGIFTVQPLCLHPKSQVSSLHFPTLSLFLSVSLFLPRLSLVHYTSSILEWLFYFTVAQNSLVPESPQ